ncbi:MAG: hypothetical protein HOV68_06680 [Streptomycetaceae bacterium]|nr:hypothetical protein [Streptomycetaceae bacterium]
MRDLVIGVIGIAIGLALKLYAGDVDIPGLALDKLGWVLIGIGALDLLYGVYRMATRSRRAA